jgi:hypothetical protein
MVIMEHIEAILCSNHALASVCRDQCRRIKQLERSVALISKMHTREEKMAETRRKTIVVWNSIYERDQFEISRLKKVVRDLNLEIAIIKSGM